MDHLFQHCSVSEISETNVTSSACIAKDKKRLFKTFRDRKRQKKTLEKPITQTEPKNQQKTQTNTKRGGDNFTEQKTSYKAMMEALPASQLRMAHFPSTQPQQEPTAANQRKRLKKKKQKKKKKKRLFFAFRATRHSAAWTTWTAFRLRTGYDVVDAQYHAR